MCHVRYLRATHQHILQNAQQCEQMILAVCLVPVKLHVTTNTSGMQQVSCISACSYTQHNNCTPQTTCSATKHSVSRPSKCSTLTAGACLAERGAAAASLTAVAAELGRARDDLRAMLPAAEAAAAGVFFCDSLAAAGKAPRRLRTRVFRYFGAALTLICSLHKDHMTPRHVRRLIDAGYA